MTHLVTHLFVKLSSILQTLWGWILAICLFVLDYFAGHGFVVGFVVAVTIMDAIWGIAVSLKMGKFTLSELARLTIAKLAVYGCALFVFVGLDKMIESNLTTSIVGAAIALVELWSSCGSALILFPHILFLQLLKRALRGEIAAKLHVRPSEVEDILEGKKPKKRRTKKQMEMDEEFDAENEE